MSFGKLGSAGGSGSGGSPRAQTYNASVPLTTGVIATLSTFGLLAAVTFAKTGGNANLTINTSTGAISATAALGAGVTQTISGTATGSDGVVFPFTANLTGAVSVPAAPTIALTAGNGQVSIAWTDGSNGGSAITSHDVYRGLTPGGETFLQNYTGASPFVDTSVTNGTAYSYTMKARNAVGASAAFSNEQTGTPNSFTFGSLATAAIKYDGDSRTDNQGARTVASGSFSVTGGYGASNGTTGFIQAVCGNKWLLKEGYQHAIGASTTEAMIERMQSTSILQTGNPAGSRIVNGLYTSSSAVTPSTVDIMFSRDSDGVDTILTMAGKLVVSASLGVNDGAFFDTPNNPGAHPNGATGVRTLENISTWVSSLQSAGKAVLVGNESPRGRSGYQLEQHTVSGGTAQATVTGNFVDGETYGEPGCIGIFASGLPIRLTKVASAPAQNQYTVSSTGLYTFGGTAPVTVWLSYTANGSSGLIGTAIRQRLMNEFANSAASVFTSSVANPGVNYGMPGLKNYPNVIVFDLWNALLDTTTGASQWALPGTMDTLQLHHNQLGALKAAKAAKTAFDASAYSSAPSIEQRPTRNNWWAATGTGLTAAYSGTLPPSMRAAAVGGSGVPMIVSLNGVVIGKVDPTTGAITAGNGSTIITTGTYNWTNGAWSITASSTTSMTNTGRLWFEQDIGNYNTTTFTDGTIGRNILNNGMMDMTAATGTGLSVFTGTTTVTGTTASQIPYGWGLGCAAAFNTALGGTPTATITITNDTTGDGYPRFNMAVEGTCTANIQLAMTNNPQAGGLGTRFVAGDWIGAGCRTTYGNHPTNGSLYGTNGAESKANTQTSAVTRTGNSGGTNGTYSNMTIFGSRTIDGATQNGSHLTLGSSLVTEWGGPIDLYRMTPLYDTTGFVFSSTNHTWTIATAANIPFAGKFSLGQAQMRRRNDV